MTSTCRQGTRGWGRSSLLLSSVLALLALACFPVIAQADSVGPQYNTALPNDGGATPNEDIAKSSESPENGGAEAPAESGSGESYSGEVPPSSESGSPANTGHDGGKGQGNADKGNNPPGKAKVQHAAPLTKSSPADSSDDGGSSPLVPILIAAAVLAALSIGAVMIRQRRQRDGSSPSLSTKAG
jgi:hypothetical protein